MQQPSIYAPMVTSNPGAASLRPPTATFYTQPQQPPLDYDYKQQAGGAHIYNYLSMVPPATSNFIHQQQQQTQQLHPQPPTSAAGPNQGPSQHGAGIPMPILVQQPSGQIQYIFPTHALQQQQQQQPPLTNPYPLTPDGQYVQVNIENNFFCITKENITFFFQQLYRQDTLSIPGPPTIPPPSVVDSNNSHHHQYSQNQPYHHHPISQQQQQQQQQQQVPPSQSNPAPQPPPFVRIYPTGTPGNVSHQFAQATYQPSPQTTFVQPG